MDPNVPQPNTPADVKTAPVQQPAGHNQPAKAEPPVEKLAEKKTT